MKMIFADMDGTLCDVNGKVNDKTIHSIQEVIRNGYMFVVATGRSIDRIIPSFFQTPLSYIIALNGSQIYDVENKKLLFENAINYLTCKMIYAEAKKYQLEILLDVGLTRYSNTINSDREKLDDSVFSSFTDKKISQFVLSGNYQSLMEIKKVIEAFSDVTVINQSKDLLYQDNTYSTKHSFLDIVSSSTSKGNSITWLLNYLNVSKDHTIALGDGINDLSMFDSVSIKVAMGNIESYLKEKADVITLSNSENGASYYLDSLLK